MPFMIIWRIIRSPKSIDTWQPFKGPGQQVTSHSSPKWGFLKTADLRVTGFNTKMSSMDDARGNRTKWTSPGAGKISSDCHPTLFSQDDMEAWLLCHLPHDWLCPGVTYCSERNLWRKHMPLETICTWLSHLNVRMVDNGRNEMVWHGLKLNTTNTNPLFTSEISFLDGKFACLQPFWRIYWSNVEPYLWWQSVVLHQGLGGLRPPGPFSEHLGVGVRPEQPLKDTLVIPGWLVT
jgi:hypothetical protein